MKNVSKSLNKHFANKRITDRNNDGHITSVNALLRWCLKYQYDVDCTLWAVIDSEGGCFETKNFNELFEYLRTDVALKDGSLPIKTFRAIYHSTKVNDRSKRVELLMVGAEDYSSDPLKIKAPKKAEEKATPKLTIVKKPAAKKAKAKLPASAKKLAKKAHTKKVKAATKKTKTKK